MYTFRGLVLLVVLVVPSRVSGRGYKIGPVCVSVCLSVCLSVTIIDLTHFSVQSIASSLMTHQYRFHVGS